MIAKRGTVLELVTVFELVCSCPVFK